jgi:hypothetical protein
MSIHCINERFVERERNRLRGVAYTLMLTCALTCMHLVAPLVALGITDATDSRWERSHSSYRFSTREDVGEYVPDIGSPMRAVYDFMAAIMDRDAESLVALFADESRQELRDFVRLWAPRLRDRTLEFRRQGIRNDDGIAYVGIIGLLGGSGAADKETFADAIFLKMTDGEWILTHEVLDAAECDRVIEALDMLRTGPVAQMEAFTRRAREQMEERSRQFLKKQISIVEEGFGRDGSPEAVERIYERNIAFQEYRETRIREGTWARSFRDVMDIYDVELLSPPIAFDIDEEPSEPNFYSLLDSIRTTFYLSVLEMAGRQGSRQVPLLKKGFAWEHHNLDRVKVEGGLPEYIPPLMSDPTAFTMAGLGQVQIRGRISMTHEGVDYAVVLFMMIQTESMLESDHRLPIAPENCPGYIGSGYTYFRKDGNRWLPSRNLGGYVALNTVPNWTNPLAVYGRRHTVWGHRVEDAIERLKEQDFPEPLRRLYGVDECLDFDEALRQGVWSDL